MFKVVVNRHGQKPHGTESGFPTALIAEHEAARLNAVGYDDGPFTVAPWGDDQGWYAQEGHDEARAERGEEV